MGVNSNAEKFYHVKNLWATIQGEGFYAGTPCIFVRFVGCNMWSGYEKDRARDAKRNNAHCPLWCDTDFTKENSVRYTASELVKLADHIARFHGGGINRVVCTGGEPLLVMDSDLVRGFQRQGYHVHVETNGTVSLSVFEDEVPDWICCSPKTPADRIALEYMHELKLVIPDYNLDTHGSLRNRVHPVYMGKDCGVDNLWQPCYVQPEDGPRYADAVKECVDIVMREAGWRVSAQTHKMLGVK